MKKVDKFATAYGPKFKPKTVEYPPTRTKQSMRDECDINLIISKYSKIGVIEHINNNQASFADVSDLDFQQSLHLVQTAQDAFDELPAKIRKRFSNDPSELLSFLQNEENREEAISLGLIEKPVVEDDKPSLSEGDQPASPVEESATETLNSKN